MGGSIWGTCMLLPGFSRAECASWVQAWGSVAAIAGAFAIAFFQARHQRRLEQRRQQEAQSERFLAAAEVIRNLQNFAESLLQRLEKSGGVDLPGVVVAFGRGVPNFSSLNPLELPGTLASRVAGLQYALSMILARIDLGEAQDMPRFLSQLVTDCEKASAKALQLAAEAKAIARVPQGCAPPTKPR
jgi:hypothetical protein